MRREHEIRVWDGLRVGIFVARALSMYVLVLFGAVALVVLVVDAPSLPEFFRDACWHLPWLVGGYLLACSLAGLLCAGLSRLPRHPATHALMGFGAGTTIYGVIGIASHLMDGEPPDWVFLINLSVGIGLAWAAVAFVWSLCSRRRSARDVSP